MNPAYSQAMAEPEEQPKKGGKKALVFALLGFNVLAIGGIGYFLLAAQADEELEEEGEPSEGEGEASDNDGKRADPGEFGPLVEMKPMVGNLNDPGAGRYVKVQIHFEVKNEEARPAMEAALVPIRSELLVYFTGVKVEETIGPENKTRIIADVKKIADRVVGNGVIRRVFFTEFVTQ